MDLQQTSWLYGWLACVVCLFFTIRCAFVFAKNEPNIFLALSIYAAQWGILIVFYGKKPLNEFLPALSGYMCAIVGSVIYRNHLKGRQVFRHHILKREGLFAYLLLLVALPEALQTPYGSLLPPNISHEDIEVIVTLLLKSIGFYSLYKAVEISYDDQTHNQDKDDFEERGNEVRYNLFTKVVVLTPIAGYWVLEVAYTFKWLYYKHVFGSAELVMSPFFLFGFSLIKILQAFTFIPAILTPYKPFKDKSFFERLLLLLHIEAK
jgi:hypothetical protein